MVEQIRDVQDYENPICIIMYIERRTVYHRHLNREEIMNAPPEFFKKIPKLKRIMYETNK